MCRLFFYDSSGICARQFTKVQYMPFFIVEAYKRKTLLKARYKSIFIIFKGYLRIISLKVRHLCRFYNSQGIFAGQIKFCKKVRHAEPHAFICAYVRTN